MMESETAEPSICEMESLRALRHKARVFGVVTPSRLITQMWSLCSFERSVTIYIRQGAKTLFPVGVRLGLSHGETIID